MLRFAPRPAYSDESRVHMECSWVMHQLEALESIGGRRADAALLAGDIDLLFHGVLTSGSSDAGKLLPKGYLRWRLFTKKIGFQTR